MSFDGSGVYSLTYTWATEAASPPIAISKLDTEMAGIATGLSLCVLRNGNGVPTADTPWNAKKITNLADAAAATDAVNRQSGDARWAQLSGATFTGTVSGTAASFSTTLAVTGAATFGSTLEVTGTLTGAAGAFTSLTVGGTAVSVSGHTHSYLPLSGGTLTGTLTRASKGGFPYYDSATQSGGAIVVSTLDPSGTPAAGDLWIKYTA